MANNKPSCTAWKSVSPVAVEATEDNGDVLAPLKKVRDKYAARATRLRENAFGENRTHILTTASWYSSMADLVQRLIGTIDERVPESEKAGIVTTTAEQVEASQNMLFATETLLEPAS